MLKVGQRLDCLNGHPLFVVSRLLGLFEKTLVETGGWFLLAPRPPIGFDCGLRFIFKRVVVGEIEYAYGFLLGFGKLQNRDITLLFSF